MFVLGLHKLGDWLRKHGGGSKDRLSCLGLYSPGWFASRPSQCVIHILLCCTLNLMVAGTGFRGEPDGKTMCVEGTGLWLFSLRLRMANGKGECFSGWLQ